MEPINVRFQQLSFELWMQPIDETEGFVSLDKNSKNFCESANPKDSLRQQISLKFASISKGWR